MKKFNPINLPLALCLSVLVFSCGTKKQIGFFSNTSDKVEVKHNAIADPNTSDFGAMAEGVNEVQSSSSSSSSLEAVSDAQVATKNISTAPAYKPESISETQTTVPTAQTVAPTMEMPKKITKQQKKEIKEALETNASDTNTLLLVIIAILLPPLAVLLVDGIGGPFLLSIILWLLFVIPGIIYALWRVLRKK